MAFNLFGGKRRITKGFFANSLGNKQTRGIYTFQIDVENGELIFKKYFVTPTDPVYAFNYGRFSCITYRNRTGSVDDGGICSYAATAETLALASRVTDKGKTYVHACANGDVETADKVFCVDYFNSEISVISIIKKKLVKCISHFKLNGSGKDPVKQAQPYPTYVSFLPDEDKLYVVCLGLDQVCFFDVGEDGTLTLDNVHTLQLEPGCGSKKMIFNQKGDRAYVMNELNSTICVYKYDHLNFELIQTIDSYPKDDDPELVSSLSDIKFNSDDSHLYAINKGHDSLVLFEVNEDGTLTYIDFEDTSYDPVDMLVYNEEGNEWIVVACQKGGIVESYRFGKEKGGQVYETEYSCMVNEPYNARRNGVEVKFEVRDILRYEEWEWSGFDVIVSNPPYVRESEKALMHDRVLNYEPSRALFVPDTDPLMFYRKIAGFGRDHLNRGGVLFFEINEAFGKETVELLREMGYEDVELRKDINERERMVKARGNFKF